MAKKICPDDRWSWVEVDLAAVRRNTAAFKRRLARLNGVYNILFNRFQFFRSNIAVKHINLCSANKRSVAL